MIVLALASCLLACAAPAEEGQGKAAASDPDRPAIPASEIKALRENNIFAPRSVTLHGPRAPKVSGGGSHSEPVYTKPKPPVVTGIFLNPNSNAYEIIIEDPNESSLKQFKEPKFLKDGDQWGVLKVELIRADHADCRVSGAAHQLGVGESLPEGEWKSEAPSKAAEEDLGDDDESKPSVSSGRKPEASTQTPEERTRVLEEMKRRNGKKNRPKDPEE